MMELEVPQEHGWNNHFMLQWPDEAIPADIIRKIDIESEPIEDVYDSDSEDEVEDDESKENIEL